MDKKAIYSKIQLTWPNPEEKDYLLGLLKKDGVTCGYTDNTPVPASEDKPKKAPKVAAAKANIDAAPPAAASEAATSTSAEATQAGSPGVITADEQAQIDAAKAKAEQDALEK